MDGGTYWLILFFFKALIDFLGKTDPVIEDDPATRQRKALAFSEYETEFFKKVMKLFISIGNFYYLIKFL